MIKQVHGQRFTRNHAIPRSFINIHFSAIAPAGANKIAVRCHV